MKQLLVTFPVWVSFSNSRFQYICILLYFKAKNMVSVQYHVGGWLHVCPLKQHYLLWAEAKNAGRAGIVQLWSSPPPELTSFSPFHCDNEMHAFFLFLTDDISAKHCTINRREYNLICLMEKEWNGYYDWPLLSPLRRAETSMFAKTVQH